MVQVIFFTVLVAGLFCIGGFLWSVVEERPKAIWLIGAAITIIVGIAGLALFR